MTSKRVRMFCKEDFYTLSKEVIKGLQVFSSKKKHLDIDSLSEYLINNGVVANLLVRKAEEAEKNLSELLYWKELHLEHKNKCIDCENENATKDILLRKLVMVFNGILHTGHAKEANEELKEISTALAKDPDREVLNRCITKLNFIVNKYKIKDMVSAKEEQRKKDRPMLARLSKTPLEVETDLKRDIFFRILNKLSVSLPNVNSGITSVKRKVEKEYIIGDPTRFIDEVENIIEKQISFYEKEKEELKNVLLMLLSELNETEKNVIFAFNTYNEKTDSDKSFFTEVSEKVSAIKDTFELSEYVDQIKDMVSKKVTDISDRIRYKLESDLTQSETIKTELGSLCERIKRAYDEVVLYHERVKEHDEDCYTDALTGVLSKRAIDLRLKETYDRFKEEGKPCAIMVCDLDKLKEINENFGYSTGDTVLAKVAYILRKNIRSCDFVGRCGGEEFLVVLPDMEVDKAEKIAEKIRAVVDGSKFFYKDQKVNVAVSIGISQFINKDNYMTVFEQADKALFMAKSAGRNRVVLHSDVASGNA